MKHTLVLLILFLCLVSCKKRRSSFINPLIVKNCINNKLEKDIDVYKEFEKIENLLIKTNLLDKVSKKSYIKIFNELNSFSDNSSFLINLNKFHTITRMFPVNKVFVSLRRLYNHASLSCR